MLLCEDQVECTACGISQMNQTRIETSNQKATMRSEREDLWEKLNICDIKQILSHIIWTRKKTITYFMFAYVTTAVTLTVQKLIFRFVFITFCIDLSVTWLVNELRFILIL